ncbi:MAG: hypothetical protein JSS29_04695 [Proteobacteria bacterium]|nr:hypothetical protein [Pseudomonadota bacterium]
MKRRLLAIVLAWVTWFSIAIVVDFGLRTMWPAYAAVERALTFTLGMQVARLLIAVAASLAAGFVAARVAPGDRSAAWISAIALLVLFLPEHIRIGARLPLWYHLTFLLTLVPLMLVGDRLGRRQGSATTLAAV